MHAILAAAVFVFCGGSEIGCKFFAADTVTQSNRDGSLCGSLTDDMLIEFGHDLSGRHLVETRFLFFGFAC